MRCMPVRWFLPSRSVASAPPSTGSEGAAPASIGAAAAGWHRSFGAWLVSAWSTRLPQGDHNALATRAWDGSDNRRRGPSGSQRMEAAQQAFEAMLEGIPAERVASDMPALPMELRLSIGLRDLWALRPALFEMAARHFDQAEAQRRLAALDRRYPPPRPAQAAPRTGRPLKATGRGAIGAVSGVTAPTPR